MRHHREGKPVPANNRVPLTKGSMSSNRTTATPGIATGSYEASSSAAREKPQGSPPHRLLLINAGSGPGGPTAFLSYLLKDLNRMKFTPFVLFYFADRGPHVEKLKALGAQVLFASRREAPVSYVPFPVLLAPSSSKILGLFKDVLAQIIHLVFVETPLIWNVYRLLKRGRFSLIVLNNDVHYHLAGTVAAWLAGVPCICRKAGGIGEGKRLKRFLIPLVDLFICVSRATERDLRENNPPPRRLTTIYEGVDVAAFQANDPSRTVLSELGVPKGRKVVGLVSRYEVGKGHMETLEAAALVVRTYPNVVFLIVGGGESAKARQLKQELDETVRRLGIEDVVIFTGWREDVPRILAAVDIFVHCPTTWLEGLGIANLEAMAMGKPTIVSDNGGLPDAVVDGVTGFVIPPASVEILAWALLKLLKDENLACRLGRNARRRVVDLFAMATNTRKLEAFFEEYSAAGRRRARRH